MKIANVISFIMKNLSLVKYYADAIIYIIDMMDGVQDWYKNNPPPSQKTK